MDYLTLQSHYKKHKKEITHKLAAFKTLSPQEHFHEFLFCTLTPQSQAKKCWDAVEHIARLPSLSPSTLIPILQTRTRFHNNKAKYIITNQDLWPHVQKQLTNPNRKELRNFLADTIYGYGMKEAGHFLRNIGKSDNQIAILDRHILRNLVDLKVIKKSDLSIKNKQHYLELESAFLSFSKEIKIPIDHLDLAFWSYETGEIFK